MALLSDPEWRLTYTRNFVRELGFVLGLDLDETLIIEHPPAVSIEQIVAALKRCQASLIFELQEEAKSARRQFVGGPLNGQRCNYLGWRQSITIRLARGKWVAYWIADLYQDGRAFYVGQAPSERKARALAHANGPRLGLGRKPG